MPPFFKSYVVLIYQRIPLGMRRGIKMMENMKEELITETGGSKRRVWDRMCIMRFPSRWIITETGTCGLDCEIPERQTPTLKVALRGQTIGAR